MENHTKLKHSSRLRNNSNSINNANQISSPDLQNVQPERNGVEEKTEIYPQRKQIRRCMLCSFETETSSQLLLHVHKKHPKVIKNYKQQNNHSNLDSLNKQQSETNQEFNSNDLTENQNSDSKVESFKMTRDISEENSESEIEVDSGTLPATK
jgi:hypothetical protein